MKLDLGWGNSVCIRQAFLKTYRGTTLHNEIDLSKLDYPDRDGDKDLIEITKKIIQRQIGKTYKHILLTNGATGGVVISLRAYRQMGYEFCHTRKAPWYLRYPDMIRASGLLHYDETSRISTDSVFLFDLPSNPLGLITIPSSSTVTSAIHSFIHKTPVIIDGVYLNKVYANNTVSIPTHEVMVGSYSKLLGMNGIRIGWIATNDDLLYDRIKSLVIGEYCGLSVPSTEILKSMLHNFEWQEFETLARIYLDSNREEWSKLDKFFDGQPVTPIGMFHYASIDKKCKEMLEKASITYTKGVDLGTDNGFGRFNMGQDRDIVKNAVQNMLKIDRLK